MNYNPDTWRIVKLTVKENGNVHHRIIAGWYGGFTTGDEWRLSSGIERIIDKGDYWEMPQTSGSVYTVYKNNEQLSSFAQSSYNNLVKNSTEVLMELVEIKDILKEYQ